MGFFDDVTESVNKLSKNVSDKTKNMSTISKLNSEINQAKRDIETNINAIGRAALAKKDSKYKEFIEKIETANALIEKNTKAVKALKGNVVCQNCGAESKVGADFCGKCGAKLEKPETPEPEAPAAGNVCSECGVANTADAAFCAGCGAKLSAEPKAEEPAAK